MVGEEEEPRRRTYYELMSPKKIALVSEWCSVMIGSEVMVIQKVLAMPLP